MLESHDEENKEKGSEGCIPANPIGHIQGPSNDPD